MPSDKKLARNNEALAQCNPIYTVIEKEPPKVVANRLELFKSNTAAKRPTANERTFDLFPNLIPVMTEIMLTSIDFATLLGAELSGHPKLSTATICFYQVFVLYGFFLVNDCFVRPTPSNAAKTWLQSTSRTRMLNFIKRLPVPHWMLSLFAQWSATSSNHNGNVFIVPSACSVRLETHLGRFFPANFFSAIHDIAATLPGNSDPSVVYTRLFYSVLSELQIQGHTAQHDMTLMVRDLLGLLADNQRHTHTFINSRVYQAFDALINPVLFRDLHRRKTLAKVNLMPTEFTTVDDFNIYDLLFCFNEQNDAELLVILETVATALDKPAGFTVSLGQAIANRSGLYIFDHGYTNYLLPTWTTTTEPSKDKKKGPTDPKKFELNIVSNRKRAQDLTFLTGIPPPATSSTPANARVNIAEHATGKAPASDDWKAIDDKDAIKMRIIGTTALSPPLYLGATSTSEPLTHEISDFVSFDPTLHVDPEYQILDFSGDAEETAWLIGLSGKIIETFEIDGTTVGHPDPTQNTAIQNHQQGESLIPIRYAHYATQFYGRANNNALVPPRHRVDNVSDDRIIASTHLVDRTTVAIPTATINIRDAAIPAGFPGIRIIPDINWLARFQYFLGFRAADRLNHSDDDDEIPHMPRHQLYVFSPYMYSGYEDHRSTSFRQSVNKTYWVTNLRAHFGSDIPLIDAVHPYKAHPLV